MIIVIFKCGVYVKVYKISDEKCLKFSFEDYSYQSEVFKIIMDMGFDNMYKIYQLFYKIDDNFGGYTMPDYHDIIINVLLMPMEFSIVNFMRLANTIKKISDKHIVMNDLHDDNCMITNVGIAIIDINLYSLDKERDTDKVWF